AIWLGQLAALRARGIARPRYVATAATYDPLELRRVMEEGVILLSGGGNFGDVWPRHQELRERVLHDFPERRIVQLPQSIEFRSQASLAAARRIIAGHRDFTLLVRSERALGLARQFDAPSALCPDLALRMPMLEPGQRQHDRIVWLRRNDQESAGDHAPAPADVEELDWLEESPTGSRQVVRWLHERPRALTLLGSGTARLYERLARARVRRGVGILSRGRGVITDRLHAHILSLMAGIPHCVLDNNYGKVKAVYETWTRDVGPVAWCESADEAFTRIRELTA
ncbi:MAG TPA: polysaccharide pyruvyl transferase family protein, partial [Gemmatimonadales bacterium]|nr:polysaccharide pyruvyl transferase family protein [Gemmatimonadales bacterium]